MGSANFNYTGGWQSVTIPKGVNQVRFTINGAGASGTNGGKLTGFITLNKKQANTLAVAVGGLGHARSGNQGGSGGWPNGGDGGDGYSAAGGAGGAGSTCVRLGGRSGKIILVAGGAGGSSGDGGGGGRGGDQAGEDGSHGTAGSNAIGNATGGTQQQAGNGGTSSSGPRFVGHDAGTGPLGQGGHGGGTGGFNGPGGGAGGGGWRSGGGGPGGSAGFAPGGGGGGGSDYFDPGDTQSVTGTRGGGNSGNGDVSFAWNDPPAQGNSRPNTPHIVGPGKGTRIKDFRVTVKATLTDPDSTSIRMKVLLSKHSNRTGGQIFWSSFITYDPKKSKNKNTASVVIKNLDPNTHYYVRVWAVDGQGASSLNFADTDFFSDYAPTVPTLTNPHNGAQLTGLSSTTFSWLHHDPDNQSQDNAQLRWQAVSSLRGGAGSGIGASTPTGGGGGGSDWTVRNINGTSQQWVVDPLFFKGATFYRWQVRTRDPQGLWSPWSNSFTFYVAGVSTPPRNLYPDKDRGVDVGNPVNLRWKFTDPNQGDQQWKADIRYRIAGQSSLEWITKFGTHAGIGSTESWRLHAGDLAAGYHYEWQARTYDQLGDHVTPSDWSDSAFFHSVATPGTAQDDLTDYSNAFEHVLGCGHHRIFLVTKGGKNFLGELTPVSALQYSRERDTISSAKLSINLQANPQNCQLGKILRTWQHEIVIYRENVDGTKRVWEGPITGIAYHPDRIDITARDVMAWVYRRIMRQGYDDSHPNVMSVVARANQIIVDALARDDPNILPYLTTYLYDDDAQESRIRPDWSSTAWEEVDLLAAKHGLDYVVVGRRIILNDTHRPIGRLPLMRNGDFDQDPVISEYGMNLGTVYGVTNGNGVWGSAFRPQKEYGKVELLSSAYGSSAAGSNKTMTQDALDKLISSMDDQAQRNIAHRYPAPVQVRVPDGSTIRPHVPVSINFLIPGVWVPITAEHVCRTVTQWQKLDKVVVTEDPAAGEKIAITLSPAPNQGNPPNSKAAIALTSTTEDL